ncbi:xanthine dehydrogenase family protein molybdopterin-binding subunit [Rhodopseudomonas palustris]|nr:xanthine dehydrogenase family protein molybdopterin-binding subunit [Rhodopseudomonas palustris]
MGSTGIGASVPRKEDKRHLHGQSTFIGDLVFPRMLDVAFVRSPVAHAILKAPDIEDADRSRVFAGSDLDAVRPILAEATIPGYQKMPYPVMARDKVNFVGQILAACVGKNRADAEDIAERVMFDFDELDPLTSAEAALQPGAPAVHPDLPDNIFHRLQQGDDFEPIRQAAPVKVTRTFKLARQAMVPIEGRGVVALWDERVSQLIVYSSTQSPHLIRTGLSEFLDLDQNRIRVIAPDVGGGFGYKAILHPEELILGFLAMKLRRPVRWLEDRREHLTAAANSREHIYTMTAYADEQGRLLGLDADIVVDAGAYSIWPHTCAFDAIQAAGILPGPYQIKNYRVTGRTVATNKPPIQAYRAVARPGACFATELIVDAVARAVNREPHEVRRENLIPVELMPYRSVTGKLYDSGDYPKCLETALGAIDLAALRKEQQQRLADGRSLLGVGFATYTEHTGISTSVLAWMNTRLMPGHEQAAVRITPDGGVDIRTGVQSHGQGMETSFAQVASQVLGIHTDQIQVTHGDTALTPYSTGTYASRGMVMVGGAIADACDRLIVRLRAAAAHLMQRAPDDLVFRDGAFHADAASMTIAEIARVYYFKPAELPEGIDSAGLEVVGGYRPQQDSGAFAYSSHVCVLEIDRDFATVKLRDYVAVDDCGIQVNPMIVDGQIWGGIVQGIGTALFEEVRYDEMGQPQASTLADYLVPGCGDVPTIRLLNFQTASPFTRFGVKGVGEGGAIAPPAAIVNAVNDALRSFGAEVAEVPVTPSRILAALDAVGLEAGFVARGAA